MASYMSLSSSNSSNEDMSMHLNRLYTSGNSSNIRTANSRRKNRNTQDFDYNQTWHSNHLDSALESATSSSRSLLNSQRFSGSKVHRSQDKLQKQLLQRNHNLQQNGVGPNSFTQTSQPMLFSSDSDNSPNSSRERDLSIEEAIRPGYYHSTPENSIQDMPALHFSSSSNDSLENNPPSYHYGNSM